MSEFRRVARTGALVAAIAVVCRVASLGKELMVAAVFGASAATDAYSLAMILPHVAMATLLVASRSAFLTQFPTQNSEASQQRLVDRFLTGSTALAIVAAISIVSIAWITVPFWVRGGPELERMVRSLLPWSAGILVVYAMVAATIAISNARGRFGGPQWTALIPTTVVALAVLFCRDRLGPTVLVAGLCGGAAIQVLVLGLLEWRHGFRPRMRLDCFKAESRPLWAFTGAVLLLGVVSQLNVVVDRAMASSLSDGGVAVLTWSGLVRDIVSGTMIGGFVSVLLPHFSVQSARGSRDEIRRALRQLTGRGAQVVFPITVLICVPLPWLLADLQWGNLKAADIAGIAACVSAYGIGFYADLVSNSMYQALLALGRMRSLIVIAIIFSFSANIVFNLLLIDRFGYWGLALSTSIVGYCTLFANACLVHKTIGNVLDFRRLAFAIATTAGASAIAWWSSQPIGILALRGLAFSLIFITSYAILNYKNR